MTDGAKQVGGGGVGDSAVGTDEGSDDAVPDRRGRRGQNAD